MRSRSRCSTIDNRRRRRYFHASWLQGTHAQTCGSDLRRCGAAPRRRAWRGVVVRAGDGGASERDGCCDCNRRIAHDASVAVHGGCEGGGARWRRRGERRGAAGPERTRVGGKVSLRLRNRHLEEVCGASRAAHGGGWHRRNVRRSLRVRSARLERRARPGGVHPLDVDGRACACGGKAVLRLDHRRDSRLPLAQVAPCRAALCRVRAREQ